MKTFFAFVIPLFLIYPLNMSIETWGLMPKSQEDGETVEGAIVRLISAHEADPEAHTGIDESLAAHREYGILDHKAGSVLADKMTFTEMMWEDNFTNLSHWTMVDVNQENIPGVFLPYDAPAGVIPRIFFDAANFLGSELYTTVDYYWQSFAFVDARNGDDTWEMGLGVGGTLLYDGFGFKVTGTQCSVYFKLHTTLNILNVASFADGKHHVFRAQYVAIDEKVYFYVDGVLVGELAKPNDTPVGNPNFGMRITTNHYDGEATGMFQLRITAVGGLN
jgi:hypothetical protein